MNFLLLVLVSFFARAAPLLDHPWEWFSDPNIMARDFERNFSRLPLKASLPDNGKFWSGDYWPLNRGNINYRWKAPRPAGFNLRSPTLEEARRMSLAELSHLAPSEKYDLLIARYDYPLKREVERVANPAALIWEGICHGWAPASMNHREPTAKGIRNPDGIMIPFGSADIKALLSYYYANGFQSPTHQMGRRCYTRTGDPDCDEDLNAGAFHIVLANKLAFRSEGIIVDMKRSGEVWNHPIVSYSSKVLKWERPINTSAPGTVRRPLVETVARFIMGTGNSWTPVRGTSAQKEVTRKYVYFLDLSISDEIIGGDWESDERPDFLWVKYRPQRFEGIFHRLGDLLND